MAGKQLYATGFTYDHGTGQTTQDDPRGTVDPATGVAIPDAGGTTAGRVRDGLSYGGYGSTVVKNPDGSFSNDPSQSGVNDAVNRYQSLGAAAANRAAASADYSQANQDALQGQTARASQNVALNGLRNAAMGNAPSATTGMGRAMIDQQLQGQLAGSAGARPGGLAAAAGAAASMAQHQGVANAGQLAGMRAGEMMEARGAYGQGATAMRGGDYAQQETYNKRAITQGGVELQQAGLNQAQQMGMEGLAQGARFAQDNTNMKQAQTNAGIYQNSLGIDNQEKNRSLQYLGSGASAVGSSLAAAAAYRNSVGGGSGSGSGGGIIRTDPYTSGGGGDGYDGGIYRNDPYGGG